MQKSICRLLLLSALFFSYIDAQSRIVGANVLPNKFFKKFNFVVAVGSIKNLNLVPNQKDVFAQFCTGTLLSPTWVLTAGHCLGSIDIFIYAKSNKLFNSASLHTALLDNHPDAQISKVKQIFYPYKFNLLELRGAILSVRHDIALLELETPVYIDKYPSLGDQDLIDAVTSKTKVAHMLGWGEIENNKLPTQLMHTTLNVIDHVLCRRQYYRDDTLSRSVDIVVDVNKIDDFDDNIICAGVPIDKQPRGPCFGDSGAGLIYYKDGEPYILGVLSNGATPCGFIPDKYTNVSKYRDYLIDTMKNKGKNYPLRKDIIRKGYVDDLPKGFHMLGIERTLDSKSDIFESVKSVWFHKNKTLHKIDIENGHLPKDVKIQAKSGFWIQK